MAINLGQGSTLKWICAALAGTSAALVFALLAWSVNKGFELSDESYYCLSTANPHRNSLLNSYFGLITHRLCLGVSDLRGLRICHLVYQLGATIIFAVSFLKFFSQWYSFRLSARVIIVLALIMGSALNFDYLPLAMSYNSWSLILSLLFFSCALQSLCTNTWAASPYYFLMGFCAALLFYNKLPNGLAVAGLFTFYLICFKRKQILLWFLAGVVGALFGALLLFGSPALAIEKSVALVQNLTAISGSTLGAYADHFVEFVVSQPGWKLVAAEIAFIICMWLSGRSKKHGWIGILVPALNLLLLFLYSKGNSFNPSYDFVILFILLCTALGMAVYSGSDFLLPREPLMMVIIFYCLPFLLAFGTSNVIFYTSSQLGVFFVASVLVLGIATGDVLADKFLPILCAGLSVVFMLVVFNGLLFQPYRQQNLLTKTLPLVFSVNAEGVLESPERYVMLAELTEKLRYWNKDESEVFASPPVLGTIILAGMRPAEVFWFTDDKRAFDVNRYFLSKWKPLENPFLLVPGEILESEAHMELLKSSGVDIVKEYIVCDSVFVALNQQYFYFCKPLSR